MVVDTGSLGLQLSYLSAAEREFGSVLQFYSMEFGESGTDTSIVTP